MTNKIAFLAAASGIALTTNASALGSLRSDNVTPRRKARKQDKPTHRKCGGFEIEFSN